MAEKKPAEPAIAAALAEALNVLQDEARDNGLTADDVDAEIQAWRSEEGRLDAVAEADYQAGRVVAHERVMEWLEKLAKGERVPRPHA